MEVTISPKLLRFYMISGIFVDTDECTAGTDNCDTNAACTNTVGSFTCACNTGYNGDGTSCTGEE
jgi:hypothetical protein